VPSTRQQRIAPDSPRSGKSWLRLSAFLILLAAIVLFAAVFAAKLYRISLPSFFLSIVLISLISAIVLHARYLILLRNENQQTVTALDSTGREFKSIFDNALDGILILDDRGNCIDVNPAASQILGVGRDRLLGHSISKFYANPDVFADTWAAFLEKKHQRGSAELKTDNGTALFVDYTASANNMPGRHVIILCDVTQRVHAEQSLRQSEERFQRMATNIQEIFWMMNAETKEVIYVSKAYETITGRPLSDIQDAPASYRDLICPEDRRRVLTKLEEAANSGRFDEEFRILRADGALRWISCTASAIPEPDQRTRWLVGIAQDVTSRKHAEEEVAQHLAAAEAARAEADALRKASLTLTQNLKMDALLDTLLDTLLQIVPYDQASVMLAESDSQLMVAREAPRRPLRKNVLMLDARDNPFLQDALVGRKNIFIEDSLRENQWLQNHQWLQNPAFADIRSWLCIPLIASDCVFGLLSLGSSEPSRFTREHLRLAKSLALSAAIAIQNARLYERAEIYAYELELKLKELKETQTALEQTQARSRGTGQ
jgi:PAS domain S-box-containing protein